ncbi:MAG TPA: PQQ-binding-like beta-propeller repeat protein [Actinomycetota bacterium]|jgi:outer membrane protein assembly factor BamB|nr:PQQ-binding-like beta-propeller repeat protein [Actinomycetota bacterium]
MASFRERLERDVERISPPDLTYDDLWRRRDRKRRNERIRVVVVALLIAALGVLVPLRLLGGFGRERTRPAAPIDRSTVGDLGLRWDLPAGGAPPATTERAALVIDRSGSLLAVEATSGRGLWRSDAGQLIRVGASGGSAFAITSSGELLAFDGDCRRDGGPCAPEWTGDVEGAALTALTPANGLVLVSSTEGLHAFDVSCGASPCGPVWTAPVAGGVTAAPIVAGGTTVVASADGTVYAFDLACGRDGSECAPSWTAPPSPEAAFVSVAAGVDAIYAGATDGNVYTFPAGCRDDGGTCAPSLFARSGSRDAVRALTVGGSQVLAAPASGGLIAFPTACDLSPCGPSWRVETVRPLTTAPALSGGLVFAVTVDGTVLALDGSCLGSCEPLEVVETGFDTATIAVTTRAVVVVGPGAALGFTTEGSA